MPINRRSFLKRTGLSALAFAVLADINRAADEQQNNSSSDQIVEEVEWWLVCLADPGTMRKKELKAANSSWSGDFTLSGGKYLSGSMNSGWACRYVCGYIHPDADEFWALDDDRYYVEFEASVSGPQHGVPMDANWDPIITDENLLNAKVKSLGPFSGSLAGMCIKEDAETWDGPTGGDPSVSSVGSATINPHGLTVTINNDGTLSHLPREGPYHVATSNAPDSKTDGEPIGSAPPLVDLDNGWAVVNCAVGSVTVAAACFLSDTDLTGWGAEGGAPFAIGASGQWDDETKTASASHTGTWTIKKIKVIRRYRISDGVKTLLDERIDSEGGQMRDL